MANRLSRVAAERAGFGPGMHLIASEDSDQITTEHLRVNAARFLRWLSE